MTFLPQMASAGFVAALSYPAGAAPTSVAVGDFNGDGIADLAIVGDPTDASVSPTLSVLLGHGDGSFGAPQQYPVGRGAQPIALGDFNGDGWLDIVVSNISEGTLSVFLGNGDGTFQHGRTIGVGGCTGVVVGDFDGDGVPDLAVATYNGFSDTGSVSILLGKADGSFRAFQSFAVSPIPWSVAVADFNGDGILDLAVTNSELGQEGNVSILLGNGDGTFQAAVNYPVGNDPRAVTVGDFNGDGHLDLAVSNMRSWTVSVLLGNGDGTFQAAQNFPSAPAAFDSTGYFYTLAVSDFNGDGRLDLAVTGQYGVVIWLGQGDGSFQTGLTYDVGTGPVAVGDFNQDGQADLAVTNGAPGLVRILLGRGDGTFQGAPSYPAGVGDPSAVAVGDFNGDGMPDLAVGNSSSFPPTPTGSVAIWLGRDDGTFQQAPSLPTDAHPVGVAVADFNGDGKQDLLVTVYFAGFARPYVPPTSGLRVWMGNGNGGFAPAYAYNSDAGTYPAALGDFNGDGIPDAVVPNFGFAHEGNSVTVLLGKGHGIFRVSQNYTVLAQPSAVAVADFNGDGNLDVAVAAPWGLSILLGNGDGTFQTAKYYPHVPGVSLAVADFNHDGIVDLAVWEAGFSGTPGTVQILLGQGDGTFQPGQNYPAGSAGYYTSGGLVAGDFNGDGIPDLAVPDAKTASVSVLLGKGDGTFAQAQNFAVDTPVNALAVADFNGDGNLDLAVASGSTVTILLNDGNWPP